MEFTVNKEWLVQQLANDWVNVIDCRFDMSQPHIGKEQYETSHIPGSVYLDLEKDLSSPVEEHGGRHPLPDLHTLKNTLEKLGISNESTVVVYDSGSCENASRAWWLLSYLGHERVFLLDGGFAAWEKAGYPLTDEPAQVKPATFRVNVQSDMLATYEDVQNLVASGSKETILIDSRSPERYRGDEEPIDAKAGRIPGAINHPWQKSLQANGSFKNEKTQQERFEKLNPDTPLVVYCGSGITAATNYLALKQAGYQDVKLYAGSFSDWISYPESPVEKG